jgi:regulator of protease activity HflC (stomatin/prohibitin superfamily)
MSAREILRGPQSGVSVLLVQALIWLAGLLFLAFSESAALGWTLLLLGASCIRGYFQLKEGEAMVMYSFGQYKGTVKKAGFYWENPLYQKERVCLKPQLWQNAAEGTDWGGLPLQAKASVNWHVADAAQALAMTENIDQYAQAQCLVALSDALSTQAYPGHEGKEAQQYRDRLNQTFLAALRYRLQAVGLEVSEGKILHLAPSAEGHEVLMARTKALQAVSLQKNMLAQAVPLTTALVQQAEKEGIVLTEAQKTLLSEKILLAICGQKHP